MRHRSLPYPTKPARAIDSPLSLVRQLQRAASNYSPAKWRRNSLAGQLQRSRLTRRRVRRLAAEREHFQPQGRPALSRESTQLGRLPTTLRAIYNFYLEAPGQPFLLGSLALLIGFYLAGSLSTIFGAKGFWEPVPGFRVLSSIPDRIDLPWPPQVIALGPLLVSERVTREYYTRSSSERSQTLKL